MEAQIICQCAPGHKAGKWRAGIWTEFKALSVCWGPGCPLLEQRGLVLCCSRPGHIFGNLGLSVCVPLAVIPPGSVSCSSLSHMTSPCWVSRWPRDLAAWMPFFFMLEWYIGFYFLQERSGWQVCSLEGGTQNIEGDNGTGLLQSCLHSELSAGKKDPWESPVVYWWAEAQIPLHLILPRSLLVTTGLSWSVSWNCAVLGDWVESQIKGHL